MDAVGVVDLDDRQVRCDSRVVRERRTDHNKQVRLVHQPAGDRRAAAAEDTGPQRMGVGHQPLRLERGEHRRVQPFSELDDLGLGSTGSVADDDHRAVGVPNELGSVGESGFVRTAGPAGVPAGRGGRRRVGRERLDLVGKYEMGDTTAVPRVLDRKSGKLGVVAARLHGRRGDRYVLEHRREVEVLEGTPAAHLRRHLARDRYDRGLIELCVVQSGQQVGRAGPGDRETRGRPSGQLAVGTRGERRRTLVPDSDERQLRSFLGTAKRIREAEVGVTHHPEYPRHAVRDERLDQNVRDRSVDFAALRQPNVHAVVPLLDVVRSDRVPEVAGGLTGERVVVVTVPGAPQEPLLDRSLPQWATLMRTMVVQRAESAAASRQSDAPSVDGHTSHSCLSREIDRADFVPAASGCADGRAFG